MLFSGARHNRGVHILISAALLVAVVCFDTLSSYELRKTPFYLVPILYGSVCLGMFWGLVFALLSFASVVFQGIFVGHPYSSSFFFYFDAVGILIVFLIVSTTTSLLKRSRDAEHSLARTDNLTNVANRIGFYEKLTAEIDRQHRLNKPFALLFIDCDDFKDINDRFGHEGGDDALKRMANAIVNDLRTYDIIGRIGGDEFAVLMPDISGADLSNIIDRIRDSLILAFSMKPYKLTISMGAVEFINIPQSADMAMSLVDSLMYKVKNKGKNSFIIDSF